MLSCNSYDLHVLATSQAEVKQIAVRLNQPSEALRDRLAERLGVRIDGLSEIFDFRIVRNVATIEFSAGKFRLSIEDRYRGALAMHRFDISAAFPRAVFLLQTEGTNFSRKEVIRAGQKVQEIHACHQQGGPTALAVLDIFIPFRAEHKGNLAFGSLWQPWLDDQAVSLKQLRKSATSALGTQKQRERTVQRDPRPVVAHRRRSLAKSSNVPR